MPRLGIEKQKPYGWGGDNQQSCMIARNARSNTRQWIFVLIIFSLFSALVTYGGYYLSEFETNIGSERATDLGVEDVITGIEEVGTWIYWGGLAITGMLVVLLIYMLVVTHAQNQQDIREYCGK